MNFMASKQGGQVNWWSVSYFVGKCVKIIVLGNRPGNMSSNDEWTVHNPFNANDF